MKKLFSYLLLIVFLVSAFAFFVLLNLRLTTFSPNKIKSLASDSGFYGFAAVYVRDQIVTNSNISLNDGANFTELSNTVTTDTVKPMVDGAIDQTFSVLNNKSTERIFPVQISASAQNGTTFSFRKNVNLTDGLKFKILQRLSLILIALMLFAILMLTLAILLLNKNGQKFRRLGISFISLSILLLGFWSTINYVLPNHLIEIIAKINLFQDPKLGNGLQKVAMIIISRQTIYLAIEIIGFLAIGLCAVFIAKFDSDEKPGKRIQNFFK